MENQTKNGYNSSIKDLNIDDEIKKVLELRGDNVRITTVSNQIKAVSEEINNIPELISLVEELFKRILIRKGGTESIKINPSIAFDEQVLTVTGAEAFSALLAIEIARRKKIF